MKKILLLLACVYAVIHCNAQQKIVDSLLNELKNHPQEDTVRLNLLYSISVAYQPINPDEGIRTSNEGITLAQKLKNEIGLGKTLSSKGIDYLYKGEYDSSLLMAKTALQIFEKHNYEHGIFSVLNTIGVNQFNRADYMNALSTYSKSLGVAENIKDTSQILIAISNVSLVYRALSNYTEAIQYDLRAISLAEQLGNEKYFGNVYGEAGLTYRQLKETEKAQHYYQMALHYYIKTGNKRDEATILTALGQISADKKNYLQALSYYKQALQISDSTNNIQTKEGTLAGIGDVYKNISDYANAIAYYKRGLALAQKIGDKNNTTYFFGEIGDTYTKTSQQKNQAFSYLQQSLSMAKAIGALDRQQITLSYLSNFYETQKNYEKALAFSKQADTLQNSIINYDTLKNITRLEMQYQFNKTQDSIKAVNDKQQALAKADIQKQHIIETAMMAGAGFLILAGFGAFFFYKRNRDIRTKKNEAELQSQITDTEMKSLRAQMNPHFIFNSLNSIADYIHNNQPKAASDFTAKFAKLMRIVLENSEHKEVSLADDVKALELYMQLESYRLRNKFDYHIQVDETIDQENTLVPPLILQPFIENSIWHGVAKKEGKGHISIHIRQNGDMLNCIVEDDGEGMKESTVSNEKKSLGMKITKARIDMINKMKNADASMNVSNKRNGVRAEVRLPLELSF